MKTVVQIPWAWDDEYDVGWLVFVAWCLVHMLDRLGVRVMHLCL